jgi:hypothetical protein
MIDVTEFDKVEVRVGTVVAVTALVVVSTRSTRSRERSEHENKD